MVHAQAAAQALPLGESTPLNQVVLQAPGVVQDSYGQLHVRGDHANVQYRIDGVVIPEAISGFGQSLETRFADHIDMLTGALPAQYGYRTAAIVDIQTRQQAQCNNGSVSYTGGSNGHDAESGEIAGAHGPISYYLTGSLLKDGMGIETPTSSRTALHDQTQQAKGFGTLSYVLGDDSRLNFMFGVSNNHFEIPDACSSMRAGRWARRTRCAAGCSSSTGSSASTTCRRCSRPTPTTARCATCRARASSATRLRDGFANTGHLPSYTQVNASLSQAWDFGGFLGKMEGRLSVLNVFDSVYELRDGIGVGAPQFGPRRTVYASVTKSF